MQGRNEVTWRLGQEASLAPPCSNLRSFGSKCTVLKKVLPILSAADASHSDSATPQWFATPIVIRNQRNCAPLASSRYAPDALETVTSLPSTTNGMNAVDDSYTNHPFVGWYKTTQDERHSFSTFFKKVGFWTWWLSILRMSFHTNMFCKSFWTARSEMTGCSFLVLIQKSNLFWKFQIQKSNSVLKIPNFCHLITPQTHPGHSMYAVSWNFNCVWFADPTVF